MNFTRSVLLTLPLVSGLGGALAQTHTDAPKREPAGPPPGITLAPRWNPKTTAAMPIFQQYCEVKVEDVRAAEANGRVVSCPPARP